MHPMSCLLKVHCLSNSLITVNYVYCYYFAYAFVNAVSLYRQ